MDCISGVPEATAPLEVRQVYEVARRKYGKVLRPLTVVAHHPEVFRAYEVRNQVS